MYGMVFPGLLLAGLYLAYVLVLCIVKPSYGPRLPPEPGEPSFVQKLGITARNLLPPLAMIVAVLGSILGGLASPTEAAAIGCVFAVLLTIIYGRFTWASMYDCLLKTVRVTAMIMAVLLGGTLFTGVFIGAGGITLASTLINEMQLTPWQLLGMLLFILFITGFFLDWISIVLIFLPIFTPLITAVGFDPVWFCILFLIMIQTSYLTPPLAPAIFYLRAVAPPEITMRHMYAGMMPFIGLQVIVLSMTLYWPSLVTWLPGVAMGLR
jgi:tripartite ATP-independent transporter DctM subunit